ncbi:hypothetical protein HDEF_1337 [Candidatus Hamiltonella defensa 5AT (Acyrthosiphon pisum)]|uniref:Uncharacterized protein n=1 Tax=Hamiltonella defensa subsp. Acyrthosiphon pisum (strain 5AT) TaxID=572265 RepID=C4K5Y5_HAMD5|nr:hypothetical protein HDEF_1337 [Candidatus Hamiltonella defensa 5AT (Acyrthosiphon pisum)]
MLPRAAGQHAQQKHDACYFHAHNSLFNHGGSVITL